MLKINKRVTPKIVTEQVIRIQTSDAWKRLGENDVAAIRSYFDSLDKKIIRENLVDEQHGLCAYCMKRIRKDESTVIEHFRPIKNKNSALDYQNMLGCCDGGKSIYGNEKKVLCCDAAKGNREIGINLQDENVISTIRYSRDGYIVSSDSQIDYDINNVLCLNGIRDEKGNLKYDTATQLVAGRKSIYRSFSRQMERLDKKKNNKAGMNAEIRKMIEKIEKSDEYPEFAGVMLYYLKRKMRNIS